MSRRHPALVRLTRPAEQGGTWSHRFPSTSEHSFVIDFGWNEEGISLGWPISPVTDPTVDLFVYGTLMDDGLVVHLSGHSFRKEPAILHGYRKEVPVGGYPRIVPDPSSCVQGLLLCAVDAKTLKILDRYEDEGHLYLRTGVEVIVAGAPRQAMAYVALEKMPKNCA